ncbi:MAG: 2-oxoacid:ferredoxin oxidoreductase subunit beta, partial [Nitrososphaeraceae archaeon]
GSRIYKIEDTGYDGTISDESEVSKKMPKILEFSAEWGDKIPIGIFYQNELVPTYHQRIAENNKEYLASPPSRQEISDNDKKPIARIDRILDKLKVN